MSEKDLRSRVQARLAALEIGPVTLATEKGLQRTFINDILAGRKRSVQRRNLTALAEALDCDVEYLLGQADMPRRGPTPGLEVRGVCETGVWREVDPPTTKAPLLPDPRFPDVEQWAYEVRGDGAADAGIMDGFLVVVLDARATRTRPTPRAALVVARRRRGQQHETSIREAVVLADGVRLVAPSPRAYPEIELNGRDQVEILGVVDRAVRLFI